MQLWPEGQTSELGGGVHNLRDRHGKSEQLVTSANKARRDQACVLGDLGRVDCSQTRGHSHHLGIGERALLLLPRDLGELFAKLGHPKMAFFPIFFL